MNADVWDEVDRPSSGNFFKFVAVGDSVVGTVLAVRKKTFDDKVVPELDVDTGDGEVTVTCGQANLLAQLLELRPGVGDRIAIVFTDTRKAKLGMAKIFDVKVKRADGTVDAAAAPDVPSAPSADDLL